jgi:hypothetical protein
MKNSIEGPRSAIVTYAVNTGTTPVPLTDDVFYPLNATGGSFAWNRVSGSDGRLLFHLDVNYVEIFVFRGAGEDNSTPYVGGNPANGLKPNVRRVAMSTTGSRDGIQFFNINANGTKGSAIANNGEFPGAGAGDFTRGLGEMLRLFGGMFGSETMFNTGTVAAPVPVAETFKFGFIARVVPGPTGGALDFRQYNQDSAYIVGRTVWATV